MAITDPRDIPGLVLWLSAEAETGYANDAEMATWTDLSGNGNHATAGTTDASANGRKPIWRAASGPNSGPAVRFGLGGGGTGSTGAYFSLPAILGGAAAGEVMATVRAEFDNTTQAGNWLKAGSSTSQNHYPYQTTIYDDFGTTARKTVGTQVGLSQWHRVDIWSAANDYGYYFDGVSKYATATNTVGWTASPRLGNSGASGPSNQTTDTWEGYLGAVVVYNRKLTATERADLDAWLAAHPNGGTAGALQPSGSLTATAPGRTASLAATYTAPPIDGSLAGTAPARSSSLSGSMLVTGSLAGSAPGRSGAFTGELAGAVTGSLAGTAPARSAALSGNVAGAAAVNVGTDTSNAAHLVQVSGIGYVESNPPVEPVPSTRQRGHDYIKAFAYTMPTLDNGRAVDFAPYEAEVKAHRDRIVVGGKDVTYFRGAQTPFPGYPVMQPFAYGSTTMVFPQTNAAFERAGEGALSWLAEEKRVKFQRVNVDTGAIEGTDYRGVIEAISPTVYEGRLVWTADVGGDLAGRASMREQQPRLFRWVRDIARHVHDNVQSLHLRVKDIPDIGIDLEKQGGMSQLEWLQQLCAMAVKKDGTAYTIMPSADNERVWDFRPKDTTTKHATVYFDGANVVPDLKRDLRERANKIFMRGTTPEGMKVRNGRYPGLLQANAPAYPFGAGSVGVGEVSGSDVEVMNWRLIGAKYLDDRDHVAEFTDDTADAIERLQDDAGLPETGRMDSATWDALFDLTVTNYSLRQIGVEPFAQATYIRKWNRTGSGARASRNPDYDPTRLEVHQTFDVGTGHKISTMFRWARRKRISMLGKNWVGQIQVNLRGVIRGEHTPGAPLTAADVMPVRELRPGMNLWAPLWDGGTLLHIAGIDVNADGRTATLTVDTKYRDLLETWEIIARNRESRRDPARSFFNQFRKRNLSDAPLDFDEVGGLLPDTITCPANQWTVIPIVGGLGGTIRKLQVQTATPAAYALSVWGKDPGEKNLNLTIPQPMALNADDEPVWSQDLPIFNNRILLGAWGDEKQPCGYAPHRHTNDAGNTTNAPITGLFVDEGGFSYHTDVYPVLYVAIWPTSDTTIKPQRIMWPQLEEGQ